MHLIEGVFILNIRVFPSADINYIEQAIDTSALDDFAKGKVRKTTN